MPNVLDHAVTETITIGTPAAGAYHIALTGTADYIPHMGVVMLSAARNNPDLALVFHFFTSGMSPEEKKKLETASKEMRCAVCVHLIDEAAFDTLLLADRRSGYFYRLVIPTTLAAVADRVLYLDSDMMCGKGLKALLTKNLEGKTAAVVSDRYEAAQAAKFGTKRYFNSGMMLIDIKKWVKKNCFNDIVKRAEYNAAHQSGKPTHHDQDILNQMLDGDVLFVDKKYNYLYNLDRQSLFKAQPVNEPWEDQVIIHFAGHAKPWHSWVQEWPVVRAYAAIQKDSPWKDVPTVPPKGKKNLHQAARTARMYGRYGEMLKWYSQYLAAKL